MSRGRDLAVAAGFNTVDRTRIEIVILELTRNLLVHAHGGTLSISLIEDSAHGRGIVVETNDTGPGIADIALAMQDGFSTAHTLGAGLPGVQRLMDQFHIESTVGVGTYVRAVKWVAPSQRTRVYER
jgi:serine/threonine-protein kinase RsbT